MLAIKSLIKLQMQISAIIILVVTCLISGSHTVPTSKEALEDNEDLVKDSTENVFRDKRNAGPDVPINLKEEIKRAPMRFGKRAPMRFGKRAPMRFGKRDSNIDDELGSLNILRSIRAPMRFGKRSYTFTKKAPMRFGKRAPMRFGKRDFEDPDTFEDDYEDVIFAKRAPMRFGKRSDQFDDLDYTLWEQDYIDPSRV